jgi:hypothetical protein
MDFERPFELWQHVLDLRNCWVLDTQLRHPFDVMPEVKVMMENSNSLYDNICAHFGDPLKRNSHPYEHYRPFPEGKTPEQVIIEIARVYIDAVFLGPPHRAVEILLGNSDLLASARTRVFFEDMSTEWGQIMREVISQVDAALAVRAMEAVLWNG